ncbi:MAG TPA: UDP-N-acetylglucosamine 2-epimerase (non-hydrolyzing) [bacterium]|nr:UDP-N-acetylglucosamine 2-epimerase (non-hydrolyzing) [bacterium]
MKVVTVVGARPQFIKLAPVSRALRAQAAEILVHTGQHFDDAMSEAFFRELALPRPDVNLGAGGGLPETQLAAILPPLTELVRRERPDWVLVYGDTTSTLAGALAAVMSHTPLAHVEAGLRSFDRAMPEENNRVATDALAQLLFPPTAAAAAQLKREGVVGRIAVTGDVMYDALLAMRPQAAARSAAAALGLAPGSYYLATVHRAGNTDDPARLAAIVDGLCAAPLPVVLPLHPRTDKCLRAAGLYNRLAAGVKLVAPLGYLDMLSLLQDAAMLITDSGGAQKEAYWLGVPCVTLRPSTEWHETLGDDWNVLTDADPAKLAAALARPRPAADRPPHYGDGHAAAQIVAALLGR